MIIDLSILNADLNNIEDFLDNGIAYPSIHMDIMDGIFVKELSFDENIVRRVSKIYKNSIINCHLMVQNPDPLFEKYKDAGASYIIFHLEIGNTLERIKKIKDLNIKVGLSINPDTDVEDLVPYLALIDQVLIMSVYPGRGGQKYIESSTGKLKFLKEYKEKNNLNYSINVDGGINEETYKHVKPYSDFAVIGSRLTKSPKFKDDYLMFVELFK